MGISTRPVHSCASGDLPPGKTGPFVQSGNRIMLRKILEASQGTAGCQGGLVAIYHREVLPHKTRTVRLLGVKCAARIIQTLLGYEVQARYKRILCPDLVTARYLKLFSELGCRTIRLPYDPTVTAKLVPVMEYALESIADTVANIFPHDPRRRQYAIRKIYAIVRNKMRKAS